MCTIKTVFRLFEERGKCGQKRKNHSNLCTHPCPYRLAGSALPGQRRSVSLCFRVATLLKTQFACHRVRGKLTTKEERNYSFYYFIYAFDDILCRILRSRSYFIRMFRSFTHAYRRSRMTAEVNCVF